MFIFQILFCNYPFLIQKAYKEKKNADSKQNKADSQGSCFLVYGMFSWLQAIRKTKIRRDACHILFEESDIKPGANRSAFIWPA